MGKSGQSSPAGVQRQLVGQLVKYRSTTRLRLNKCSGNYRAPPFPTALVDREMQLLFERLAASPTG